ncbi:MAG: leucyl aminopeptidase [Saprospiraceae bacterium]
MTFNQIKEINLDQDLILPCYKGKLEHLKEYTKGIQPDFDGSFASYQLLYGAAGNRIYLLGLGEAKDAAKVEKAFHQLCFETKKYWSAKMQVQADQLSLEAVKKAALGLEMASYEIGQFKSKKVEPSALNIAFAASEDLSAALNEGQLTGATINKIKALIDAPANHKTPEFLGQWAKDSAQLANYKCTVLHKEDLQKQNFDAVLAVGRGSENPPVVIVTEYMPKAGAKVDLGLVGKGITFDTGGLSIKGSQNLHYMKSDMGGAAVVLGVVELAASLELNVNIVGVVASAENAVDAHSYRPGDVINSHSGKTIEIIDTDAEGRLALADGLSYINKTFQPEYLINLATLTGSVVRTLGYSAAGMFTNNNELSAKLSQIGEAVHERVWRLPLYDDFASDLHSDIADIRNFSGKPIAGAITAAKFLEAFTAEHPNWMHLDIAGVAFGDSKYAKMKSASGYGIQLISNFIQSLI